MELRLLSYDSKCVIRRSASRSLRGATQLVEAAQSRRDVPVRFSTPLAGLQRRDVSLPRPPALPTRHSSDRDRAPAMRGFLVRLALRGDVPTLGACRRCAEAD